MDTVFSLYSSLYEEWRTMLEFRIYRDSAEIPFTFEWQFIPRNKAKGKVWSWRKDIVNVSIALTINYMKKLKSRWFKVKVYNHGSALSSRIEIQIKNRDLALCSCKSINSNTLQRSILFVFLLINKILKHQHLPFSKAMFLGNRAQLF